MPPFWCLTATSTRQAFRQSAWTLLTYLCRKRTGLAAAVIARAFNRKPYAVGYAVRVIERMLAEEPALGELLKEGERELQSGPNEQSVEAEDPDLVVRVDLEPADSESLVG
jgi:hypothetical protein